VEEIMSAALDTAEKFQAYANPTKLVSTEWLADHLADPSVVVVESDEDVLLYETGHIPGAIKVDWHADLNDSVVRDYLDPVAFAALMERKGIAPDSTIVFYGDNFNWWATYALWVFSLFGHEDVRLLDGGESQVDRGAAAVHHRTRHPGCHCLPGSGARRLGYPRLPAGCPRPRRRPQAARRCAFPGGVPRRAIAHGRLSE
jgi:thiosulfate/3-mercaptopyruvate sulfurtransferase